MNLTHFKKKYPVLFRRGEKLSKEELLANIIQLENRQALKDFIDQVWLDKAKKTFFKVRPFFETHPHAKHRYQMAYNWFIFYKRKKLWLINDMRKYKYWWTRKI